MNNFDLKKFLTENKLTTASKLQEVEYDEEGNPSIEPKAVGRDTGVKLDLKKVKKMAEAEGYEVSIEDGTLFSVKSINIKIPEAGTLTVTKNGEVFGDELWGAEMESDNDILDVIQNFIKDQDGYAE
jgi:uncharacterized protein YuzE